MTDADQANNGDTVRVHYSGKLKDGTVFDSSEGREPLQFTIGENALLPKFEEAIVGMPVGDTSTVEIGADDAYGQRRDDAVHSVQRTSIPEGVDVSVGTRLQANTAEGQQLLLTVVEVDEASVTLDANHPLAGEDLTFEIELVEIVSKVA